MRGYQELAKTHVEHLQRSESYVQPRTGTRNAAEAVAHSAAKELGRRDRPRSGSDQAKSFMGGARAGADAEQITPSVAKLSVADTTAIAAYLATLEP